jgi:hypothetical protein
VREKTRIHSPRSVVCVSALRHHRHTERNQCQVRVRSGKSQLADFARCLGVITANVYV